MLRAILALLFAGAAFPQSRTSTGAIQGIVLDPSSAPMPEVRITARGESGAARSTATGADGGFSLSGVPIGNYTLRLERNGFATAEVERFQVSVGQTVAHRITMQPANVTERVEVLERPEALETSATTSSVALGGERIEETPAQNRNYLNFVLVAPGVAASSGSNAQRAAAGARSAAPDSGFTFAGIRARNNSLSIDGVDNRDETTGGNRVAIGLEMVQEFRVSGTTLAAEVGGAAGGAVNVVTRSGVNLWHGDATFFTQNEAPNARNPEAQSRKPRFRRYQPGASINGPIRRDRTFFSTAFEQEWESSEEWSESPREAEALLPGVRRGLFPASSSSSEFSFKANHQWGMHAFSARYAFSRGRLKNDVQGGENFLDRSARASSLTADHSLVAGWIASPRPHLVNDLRAQVSTRSVDITPNSRGPLIEIPGVVSFGQAHSLDASRTENHYQLVDGVAWTSGRHQIGAGADVHSVHLDARLANRFAGIYVFPTLADFLRRAPDVYVQAVGDPRTAMNTAPVGLWLQDRWQARPGLTFEAGLRFDTQSLPAVFPGGRRNLAPRIGVAWRPANTAPFVFRAGFGLFYDRFPLAFLNDALQKDGVHGYEIFATGAEAGLAFRGAKIALPPSIYRPAADFKTTYSRKITAGMERSFGANTTLSAEYASVRGIHLPRVRHVGVYQLEQSARSAYQGVSLAFNRRLNKELTYLIAYNGGVTNDDASDYDEHPLDPRNTKLDWARSRQHQTHRLSASALFEMPGEELIPALANISVAPIFITGSGRPVNALLAGDVFRTGAYPLSARPQGLGRNPFLGPRTTSLDLRIMKGFWVVKPKRAVLLLAVESFNLLNHSNALRVSPFYAAGGAPLASYGGTVETLNARQVQFSLSLEY